jgi:hypothetical protein
VEILLHLSSKGKKKKERANRIAVAVQMRDGLEEKNSMARSIQYAIRPFFFFFAFVPEIGILSVRFTARPWISTYLYPWRNAYGLSFGSGLKGAAVSPLTPDEKRYALRQGYKYVDSPLPSLCPCPGVSLVKAQKLEGTGFRC